jgi:hypothetical protein
MTERQGDWTSVWFILVFGTLAAFFGLFACLSIVGLLLTADRFTWPLWVYLIATAALHLATATICGYTCVIRLEDRPVARWMALSLILACATVTVSTIWFPHYYFFGM